MITRKLFLYFSEAGWARTLITNFPPARFATRRFVAGETVADAIDATRQLNAKGLLATLDYLGESVHDEAAARAAAEHYLELINAVQAAGLQAGCSLKLTQLGLDVDEALCLENMRRILQQAQAAGLDVTIDMESSEYTDRTLQIFRTLCQEGYAANLGTVIQAYLYRSEADMQQLAAEGATIRLCKGAYQEPADKAFPQKADVDANYVQLMQAYMRPEARERGAYLQIATHDLAIIQQAESYVQQQGIPAEAFEFQMLYGIRSSTQEELAQKGYQVRVYIPYGTQWYPYFMRRLAERPANVWFLMRNLFSR